MRWRRSEHRDANFNFILKKSAGPLKVREPTSGRLGSFHADVQTPNCRFKLCPPRGPARRRSRGRTVCAENGVGRTSLSPPSPLRTPSLYYNAEGEADRRAEAGRTSTPTTTWWISQHFLTCFIYLKWRLSLCCCLRNTSELLRLFTLFITV